MLYCRMEARAMKRADINKVVTFELWMYHKMLRILWTEKMRNDEDVKKTDKEKRRNDNN